jgi:hypothetical protein
LRTLTHNILIASFVFAASGGLAASARGGQPVTLPSLVLEMVDRDGLARLPAVPFRCLQASSYDRAQTDPANLNTWFANQDYEQFIRTETNDGRKEWVIMDQRGPGCITRFWIPLHGPKKDQLIRFYFDGSATPSLTMKINELLSGRGIAKPPFAFVASDEKTTEGVGGNLYLPIPYASGCKITLDQVPFYYNINYRAYEPGTQVKTFTMADYEAATAAITQTAGVLKAMGSVAGPAESRKEAVIEPGAEATIDLPAGAHAVRTLEVQIDPRAAPQVLRSAVLVASFDGQPTVWCPLGEFFGCGARLHPVEDWDRSVAADGKLTARWVMPYQASGRVAVKNCGKTSLTVKLAATVGPWQWDDRSMHFHATWRHQYPVETKRAAGTMDWNYLETSGQGVYVGDTLTVFSQSSDWYGEGDERVYIDGEKMPSHMGTGTEDYYGYAWGMAHEFSSAFLSMPRRDSTGRGDWRGYTTTSRLRLLDGIPWRRSLKVDMEIWDWAATKLAYSAGAFWYARPGGDCNRRPMPEAAAGEIVEMPPKFKIAGAIECEQMKVVAKSPGLALETQSNILEWSGETQLFFRGNKVGDFVELLIPAKGTGPQKIVLYATKSRDYGVMRFSIHGQAAGKDFDAYSAESVLSGPIELGTFEPKDGHLLLRVKVVGANPSALGTKAYFGLDAVTLH